MLEGSFTAIVTPMAHDGSVDYKSLAGLIEFHVESGTDGLVIAGTTGESATLTKEEHAALVAESARLVAGRLPVIAGTGSNSTAQTIELSRAVQGTGIQGLLIVTPYYNKPTQEGLYRHYTAIAEAVDLPIVLYNVPGRTGCDLLPETAARLAQNPQIIGIKEAVDDTARCEDLRRLCGEDFLIFSGDDPTALSFMRLGARGVISVTANVAPREMHEMCSLALAGRFEEAENVNARLTNLHGALFVESNPIPAKWALERMGRIRGGIRLPLTPLSADGQARLEPVLRELGLIS